jgi:ADP-heptose:LPS heptosyltransferase
MKNLLIKGIASLARPFQDKIPSQRKRILIVSTTGLGDTLWATPAIRALKETYPLSKISVLTSPVGKSVLQNNPHLSTIFLLRDPLVFFKLRKEHFDTILIFHASQRIVFPLCFFLRASEIIATEGLNKGLDSLLTQRVAQQPIHEIERRLQITSAIGAKTSDFSMELPFTNNEKVFETSLPLIGFNPGSKDRFKQWDPACFVKLGQMLRGQLPCQIVITGGRGEEALAEEIASQIPGAISLAGKLSIDQLAALIKQMAVMVSNDTGPMHIAFAMKTPTVALFCPTDPKLCGPYHPTFPVAVISKPITCTPCLKKKCRLPFCLYQISPEEVLSHTLPLLVPVCVPVRVPDFSSSFSSFPLKA